MKLGSKLFFLALSLAFCAVASFAGETATLRNGFTIHFERREPRGDVTRLYLSESVDSFVDVPTDDIVEIETDTTPPAAPQIRPKTTRPVHPVDLDRALSAASHNNHVSPDLLRSVIRAESGFNPNARSSKGAQGLMQLMPETAARLGVKNALDPGENLEGGARYLRELLGRYHNDLPIALAAYNAGPERVEQYHGIPPYRETIAYVSRILRDLNQTQHATPARLMDNAPVAQQKNSDVDNSASSPDSKTAESDELSGNSGDQPAAEVPDSN